MTNKFFLGGICKERHTQNIVLQKLKENKTGFKTKEKYWQKKKKNLLLIPRLIYLFYGENGNFRFIGNVLI